MVKPLNIYGDIFSEVYNLFWTEFIDEVAPQILQIFEKAITKHNLSSTTILDLCCGTGRLSGHFLKKGYDVIGIDLSPDMVKIAERKNKDEITKGKAKFKIGDARHFTLEENVGMVVSTFDSLNHLGDINELDQCIQRCYEELVPGGLMVFDLNTAKGLKNWEFVDLEDKGDTVFIMHGSYDKKQKKAFTRVYGFTLDETCGKYDRFDEIMLNTVYEMKEVKNRLGEAGFTNVVTTSELNLEEEVGDPETVDRTFFIAQKPVK